MGSAEEPVIEAVAGTIGSVELEEECRAGEEGWTEEEGRAEKEGWAEEEGRAEEEEEDRAEEEGVESADEEEDEEEEEAEGSAVCDAVNATSIWFLPPMIPLSEPSRSIPCTMGGRSLGIIRSPSSSHVLCSHSDSFVCSVSQLSNR